MGIGVRLVLCMVSLCMMIGISGCKKPFSDRADDLSVFRYSTKAAPITMDPVQSATQYANLMTTSIYDQLYEYKYLARPFELKCRLAADMPKISEDGLVYTIPIKKGIIYSDNPCFPDGKGREVVVDDFIYAIKRMFDPKNIPQGEWVWKGKIKGLDEWKAAGSNYNEPIEGLKAIDKYTIQITLNQPFPQLVYTLAMGYSSVTPHEAVEYYGKEFGLNPVGSGPYQLVRFNTKKAVLKRNPNYREVYFDLEFEGYDESAQKWAQVERLQGKRLPIMDNVEIHFMKETMTRWNSLNKGNEIQLGMIPIELTNMVVKSFTPFELKKDYAEKFTAMKLPDFGLVYLLVNMDNPELGYNEDPERNKRNKLLRKAMRAAYDWEQRNERFYNGIGDVFPGVLPRALDAFDDSISIEYAHADYEKARQYLKDGGWTAENLPDLEYCSTASVQNTQFFEQFRGWMMKLGFPREKIKHITYATFGDFSKATKLSECMLIGMAWGLDYPDSENILQLFYGPNHSPGSNNSNFNNAQYNELYVKSKVMNPGPERTEIYKKMNRIILEEVPVFSGITRNELYIWHKNVVFMQSINPHGSLLQYAYVFKDESEK